jgi:hypothetical protein
MTGFRNKQYLTHALHHVMKDFYNISQGRHRINQEYYDEFNSLVLTGEECGATIGAHPGAINDILADTARKATKTATDRYLAVAFLLSSDPVCYGMLMEEIENEYLRNRNDSSKVGTYPTTVAEAYDYLCNYKKDPKNLARLLGQELGGENLSSGVSFAQQGKPGKPKNDTETQETAFATNSALNQACKKVCKRCGVDNHTSVECDTGQEKVAIFRQSQQPNQSVSQLIHSVTWDDINAPDEATNFAFLGKASFTADGPTHCTEFCEDGTIEQVHKTTIFSQSSSRIPNTWYLLDNQSTCDIVSNPKIVQNIRQVEGHMQLSTQAGSTTTNWMADVPGYYRPVRFHPGGIANILSLVNMIAKYHVTYDSHNGDTPITFCVHKENGEKCIFKQSRRGLYYLDTADTSGHVVLVRSLTIQIETTLAPN